MLKATKLTLAAALLAGSCGLAMAQATGATGAAEGKPGGSDAARPAPNAVQPKAGAPMTQKNTGMPTKAQDTGQETGTAKDSAGPGAMREESKKEEQKK
jgi:hypothetical protein